MTVIPQYPWGMVPAPTINAKICRCWSPTGSPSRPWIPLPRIQSTMDCKCSTTCVSIEKNPHSSNLCCLRVNCRLKLRTSTHEKTLFEKVKRQPTRWKKIFVIHIEVISKICKEILQIDRKRRKNPEENRQKTWIDMSQKRISKWPASLWKMT